LNQSLTLSRGSQVSRKSPIRSANHGARSPRQGDRRNVSPQAQERLYRLQKRVDRLARYSPHHGGTDDYWRRFDEMMRIAVEAQAIWSHQRRSETRQAAQS